ncbi:SAM hydrolase/SAM-dependent halogenase family protein [Crocosphaera subtropica]|nr:SAM-dependent chlorinase/fluorinase [Crocosphaera subtropica]
MKKQSEIKAIALLTDFGLNDGYVGIMKGVIASINPNIPMIDLTHSIPPQQIWAARFCLMNAYPYFPKDTVYLAVVDPGVGSQRRSVAIECSQGYLVGPDNGLFSGILANNSALAAVSLTNTDYWRDPDVSLTFHGRDIFAPVAAYLASGVPLEALGDAIPIRSLVNFPLESPQITDKNIQGFIQYIDHFGNLITNVSSRQIKAKKWFIIIDNQVIQSGSTYSEVSPGKLIALIGSHGWVEIAVNGGNAQEKLQVKWGEKITINYQ